MISFASLFSSVKRYLIWIVLITLVAAGLSVAMDKLKAPEEGSVRYLAQASLHFTYDTLPKDEKALGIEASYLGAYTQNSIFRIVESQEVAGEVRKELGESVTIQAAPWKNQEGDYGYSEFITLSASAADKELALKAAVRAAELAKSQMEELLPLKNVSISSPASLVNSSKADETFNFGTGNLKEQSAGLSAGLNKRRLLIFVFLGLFASAAAFICKDLLSRRIYVKDDLERLLNVPLIASLDKKASDKDLELAMGNIAALMKKQDLDTLFMLCPSQGDFNPAYLRAAENILGSGQTKLHCSSLESAEDIIKLAQADACVLSLKAGKASAKELEQAMSSLNALGVKVLGAVLAH